MAKTRKCIRGGLFDGGHNASTTVEIRYGDTTWELELCAKHAAELDDTLWGWLRLGREKSDQVAFGAVQPLSERLRVAPAVRPTLPAKFAEPKPPTRSEMDLLALRWPLTDHAKERLEERGPIYGFTLEDVLRAAERPERTHKDRQGRENIWIHWRGNVKVTLDRERGVIITVGGRDGVQREAI